MVFNKVDLTEKCLEALSLTTKGVPHEIIADNAAVLCTNTNEMNSANSHKTGWWVITRNNTSHGTSAEVGGLLWAVEVTTTVAGGNITATLRTRATNNLNAGGTEIASVTINNGTAAGTKYGVVVPAGTKRLKYLGSITTAVGNVTGGNINSKLQTGAGVETPSK